MRALLVALIVLTVAGGPLGAVAAPGQLHTAPGEPPRSLEGPLHSPGEPPPSRDASAPVVPSAESHHSLDRDRYVAHRGDVVELVATIPWGTSAEVRVEQPDGTATVRIEDGSDDGRVHLRWNTYDGSWSAADAADAAGVVNGSVARMPPAESYQLSLSDDDGVLDEATVEFQPRTLERLDVWQAPANESAPETATEVRAAVEDGSLERATGVDREDRLVVDIEATGLEGAVAAADGPNESARVLATLREHGDLAVAQTNPSVEVDPLVLHVLDGPGVHALADPGNDTYYLVVDLAAVRATRGDREAGLARGPYRFHVRAELGADSPLTGETEVATAPVEPLSASVDVSPDGAVHLRPEADQRVDGTTNAGTGWTVTVVLAGDDDPETATDESFRRVVETTVVPDDGPVWGHTGAFEASFDLRDVPTGAENVTVDVRYQGHRLLDEPVPVEVVAPRAAVAGADLDRTGEFPAVTVDAALSAGGFVVLHEGDTDGPVVGHSEYLDPGEHAVTAYVAEPTDADDVVAVAHRDANHNEWFDGPAADPSYDGDQAAVAVSLEPTPTSTPSPTAAPNPSSPATATVPTGTPIDGIPPTADETTPGFEVLVGVLALALVVSVLGARRR